MALPARTNYPARDALTELLAKTIESIDGIRYQQAAARTRIAALEAEYELAVAYRRDYESAIELLEAGE